MKNQRKTLKKIFALFVAILCTFGVFFVSYIYSFSDYNIHPVPYKPTDDWNSSNRNEGLYILQQISNNLDMYLCSTVSGLYGALFYSNSTNLRVAFISQTSFPTTGTGYVWSDFTNWLSGCTYDSSTGLYYTSSQTYSTSSFSAKITPFANLTSALNFYADYFSATPTPTPISFTPTPAPATPTPGIDPGPGLPTVPPGEQSYENFFARMASDAQNAFNALFASWQNANNGFYTSIFYIGIPVFIGIFGLVAYIVFGGDNDD